MSGIEPKSPPPEIVCPVHFFEANHDAKVCQVSRIERAIKATRLSIGSNLTNEEQQFVLKWVLWRITRP